MQSLVDAVWDGARTGRFDSSPLGQWSMDDGEAAQLAVLARWIELGRPRAGWKVGHTSGSVRDLFGTGIRPFGHVLRDRVFASGATIDTGRMTRPGLEIELCFQAARRLAGPDLDVDEAERSLAWVAPAFELNDNRIDGPEDLGIRVADNLSQWGVVVGEQVSPLPAGSVLASTTGTLSRDGQVIEAVAAEGHIDDHYLSIVRLVRELARYNQAVEEGDIVITGSFVKHRNGIPPGQYVGEFAGIGQVQATFTDPRHP